MGNRWAWLLASTLAATSTWAAADAVWVRCGAMLDVEGGQMLAAHTLMVREGRITEILAGQPELQGGTDEIDLSGLTCLPGLMDMHTHLTSQSSPDSYIERFTLNEADIALRSTEYARLTLEAGFTTVRDLGDRFNASIALREAINRGTVTGPRIYTAAKSLASTGGHADPTNSWRADIMGEPGPTEGVVNGVAAARQAVRQRYKDGADLIKITATGGVLSVAKSSHNPQFMPDELEAIIETARDYDMHVAAHAHGAEGMKRAIRAGVRSIEHGTRMDDEVMALMVEHGTWYVPTISAGWFVAEKAEIEGYYPDLVRPKAREIGPRIQETFGRAWRAGVHIAFGTDCGVCYHGDNAREFLYMVETGMPELEAIRTATVNSAELLGISADAGSLAVGKWADVIAVEGNPLERIEVLTEVAFVMKEGRVFKQR